MIAEIIGPDGRVHYRRPYGDPMVDEALKTPGYSVRIVDVETVEPPKSDEHNWVAKVFKPLPEREAKLLRKYL